MVNRVDKGDRDDKGDKADKVDREKDIYRFKNASALIILKVETKKNGIVSTPLTVPFLIFNS